MVSSLIDSYPETMAAIVIHLSDAYEVPWGYMRADANHYDVYYIPHSVHDGLYDADPYTTYETKFLARQAVPSDVTVDLEVFGALDTWHLTATVCIEPGGEAKTMKVSMAQVLDHYGPVNHDRNMARSGTSGVDVTLAAGECAAVDETFVLDPTSAASLDDVKFFAWAQVPSFHGGWAEVHQAAKAVWPLPGVSRDGFESGDTSSWSAASP